MPLAQRLRPVLAAAAIMIAAGHARPAAAQDPAVGVGLPDGQVIVERALEAMGGRAAFEEIRSVVMDVVLTRDQDDLKMRAMSIFPDRLMVQLDATLETRMTITMARNGEAGWIELQPLDGELEPVGPSQIMPAIAGPQRDQIDQFGDTTRAHWVLIRILEDYSELTTIGFEEFAGKPSIRVRLSGPKTERAKSDVQGDRYLFVAVEDGYPLGLDTPAPVVAGAPEGAPKARQRLIFSDRTEFGSLDLFTRMTLEAGRNRQSFRWESISFNNAPPIVFTVPDSVRKAVEAAAAAKKAEEQTPPPVGTPTGAGG